ncbi:hypothetical protein NIIDMKKI_21730 [Mycobacterium kansasii]|uniref:Trehalase-like N-terminal domain-containing protein n=1 Tax=Mycobacterium kansasii TaxID=1768 RepID=A0A7G1I7M5_MYCKA|nr:hypothetical protein NIIDMKKI_21730 [Mycobacterium kansasii]
MVLHAEPADEAAEVAEAAQVSHVTDIPAFQAAPVPSVKSDAKGTFTSSSSLRNPFPPIADYAFLSDWETTCLISPAGSVEWMCVPRPDSPACSARSWTAARAISGWALTAFRCPRHAVICPAA